MSSEDRSCVLDSLSSSPVTVIIPAYNEADRLDATIASLQQQTLQPKAILVVDDYSTDGTGDIARKREVIVLRPPHRCGSKATAQNYALPYVSTKYVVALDADTILSPDAVEIMVDAMEKDRRAIAACSWVHTQKQNTIWNKARTLEYLFSFVWFKRIQDVLRRPMICSGAFNITRTSTLRWLGGWSTDTLAEDMNLTWTIYNRRLGHTRFVSETVAYTDDPETFRHMRAQLNRWSCAWWQNLRKHYRSIWKNDKRFFILVTLSLIDGMVGSFFWPFVLYLGYVWWPFWPLLAVGWDTATIGSVAVIGAMRFKAVKMTIKALPAFWLLRTIGTYYHLKWFVLAGLLGRSVKSGYEKGH